MKEFVQLQSRISEVDFSVGTWCAIQVKITGSCYFSMELLKLFKLLHLGTTLKYIILLHLLPWHFF